jgi:hypothetical protein
MIGEMVMLSAFMSNQRCNKDGTPLKVSMCFIFLYSPNLELSRLDILGGDPIAH